MNFRQEQQLETTTPHLLWRVRPLIKGVYIFLYHSVYNPQHADDWERAYRKIATAQDDFAAHMQWLADNMTLISQSEAQALSPQQMQADRFAVVHFDDGYTTLAKHAQPILSQHGIAPTVFVNGDFAAGQTAYYRVLAALLVAQGETATLRQALLDEGFEIQAEDDAFNYLKNHYQAERTEAAVLAAWGERPLPKAHLDFDGLRQLKAAGWEIGNHTRGHLTLSELSKVQHDAQILDNQRLLAAEGLEPHPWLAYPNGLLRHVSDATAQWLAAYEDYHGFFGGGGVNQRIVRGEWLRISVGDWDLAQFTKQIRRQSARRLS